MLIGWLLLITAVAGSTVIWPIGRWALQGDGQPTVMGFWTSLAIGLACGCAALITGATNPPPQVWLAASILSVAYSVGFCTLIMRCLKIGPAGPTATVNNMAMVCGVLYGELYLHRQGLPNKLILIGALGACVALVLLGMGGRKRTADHAPVPRKWLPMVVAGGAFSGLSFMTQTYIGEMQRPFLIPYLAMAGIGSTLLLLPAVLRHRPLLRRRPEIIAGISIGLVSSLSMALTLTSFQYFGPAVVLPLTVTTPLILVLLIGHVSYHEHLDRMQLAGSVVGVASVFALAVGSA